MSDGPVHIAPTEALAAVRRMGVACGLDDSGRGDERVDAAWGAFDGERLVGAAGSPAACTPRWSAKRWPAASPASG